MVDPVRPNRADIARIAGGDPRMMQAIERLFERVAIDLPQTTDATQTSLAAIAGQAKSGRSVADDALSLAAHAPRRHGFPVDNVEFHSGDRTPIPRNLVWSDNDGTLSLGLNGDVVLQLGQEVHYLGKNTSGATILNGSPVVATGTVGASGKLTIGPAISDGTYEQRYYLGVATEDIAANDFGYVTHFGLVRGFDTSAYSDGDLLYVSASTAGEWTATPPAAPNWRQAQAIVVHSGSGGSGSVFSRARAEHSLDGLIDVFASPADGDTLQYNAAESRWEAVNGTTGSFTAASGETITVTNGLITGIV